MTTYPSTDHPSTDHAPTGRSRPGSGQLAPQQRPPLALRVAFGVFGGAMLLFNAALMLSDRAPGASARLVGKTLRELSERIDASDQTQSTTEAVLLRSDSVVHLGVWAVATVFVALAIWTWRGLAVAAAVVFAYSVVVELGQGPLSAARSVQFRDIVFNGLGVTVGVTIALFGYVVWDLLASAAPKVRNRSA